MSADRLSRRGCLEGTVRCVGIWASTLCMLVAVGCGRVGFDETSDANATSNDVSDGPRACAPAAIACDDFESGDLTRWTSLTRFGPGTAVAQAQTARVHAGGFALEARYEATVSAGVVAPNLTLSPPRSAGVLAVRQWINTPVTLTDYNLILRIKTAGDMNYTSVGGNNAGEWVISEYRNGSPTVDTPAGVATPMLDTWVCVELVFTFGSSPTVQLLVDDVKLLEVLAETPSPTYDQVEVGIIRGALTGFHIFVDDVVIATQPIGCS